MVMLSLVFLCGELVTMMAGEIVVIQSLTHANVMIVADRESIKRKEKGVCLFVRR